MFPLPLSLLSLCLAVLASPVPPLPQGQLIPLSKSFSLTSADGVVDLSSIRTHSSYIDTKYAHPDRRRQSGTGDLELTSYRDVMWYGPISVGSSNQQLLVDFDTGSSDLFLAGLSCSSCSKHAAYNPSLSSTSQATNQPFTLSYGDLSSAKGSVYLDTVSLSGLSATGVPIGAATFENGSFTTDITDGLLGLAWPQLSAYRRTPLFNALMEQNKVKQGAFAFNLADGNATLFLGGTEAPFMKPGGPVFWNDVVRKLYWEVTLEEVSVEQVPAVGNTTAIIDTGTTLIVGPSSDVAAFYSAIPGSAPAPQSMKGMKGFYTFPCASAPHQVGFTMGGVRYDMSPDQFNLGLLESGGTTCVGAVYGQERLGFWILGDAFLKGFAAVFDFDAGRVGFAELA